MEVRLTEIRAAVQIGLIQPAGPAGVLLPDGLEKSRVGEVPVVARKDV
jgi:hypothetical protein